jgi:putative aldouronate transport system substrate-binding protein
MKTRRLALLLVLTMLMTMLAACGSTTTTTTTEATSAEPEQTQAEVADTAEEASPAAEEETAAPAQEETPAEEAAPEETEEVVEEESGPKPGDIDFDWSVYQPLTDDTATLTMFYSQPPMLTSIMDSPNDTSLVYQKLEEITNVHIEFEMHNMMSVSTDFSLMVVSGDMPDIINDVRNYYTSADQAYEDGAAIDLMEYLDEMDNLTYWLDLYPSILTDSKTDSGYLLNAPRINYPEKPAKESGLMIRKDWLDDLGLDVPVTYDQFREVLEAFKTAYDVTDPYIMPYQVLSPWGLMAGGYGLSLTADDNNFYLDGDTVAMATVSDAYYDFLCMVKGWYDDGLISHDFVSSAMDLPDDTIISNNQAGVWFTDTSYIKTYEDLLKSVDANSEVTIMADLGMDEDYSGYIASYESLAETGGFSISECCDDPALAAAWINVWYDPDLAQFINYGLEGQTFNYGEDGLPHLSEMITENEFGLGIRLGCGIYMTTGGSFVYNYTKYLDDYTDLQLASMTVWDVSAADPSTVTTSELPGVTVSVEENDIITPVMGDIKTYVAEMAPKFVTGAVELTEESYAEYVANIEAMGLQKAIDAMQSAYERYLSR